MRRLLPSFIAEDSEHIFSCVAELSKSKASITSSHAEAFDADAIESKFQMPSNKLTGQFLCCVANRTAKIGVLILTAEYTHFQMF